MTDSDWVPAIHMASAVLTDCGGRTCHAVIVSWELVVLCLVGTKDAAERLNTGQTYTVDCTHGKSGRAYDGKAEIERTQINTDDLPTTKTKIHVILVDPLDQKPVTASHRWKFLCASSRKELAVLAWHFILLSLSGLAISNPTSTVVWLVAKVSNPMKRIPWLGYAERLVICTLTLRMPLNWCALQQLFGSSLWSGTQQQTGLCRVSCWEKH